MPQDKAPMPTDELVEKLAQTINDFEAPMGFSYEAFCRAAAEACLPHIEQYCADTIERLDAECERAWGAYRIAHDQAMANGSALANAVKAETERCAAIADKIATEFGERWMTLNDGKPERERDYQNGRIAGYSDGAALVATEIRQQEAPDEQG